MRFVRGVVALSLLPGMLVFGAAFLTLCGVVYLIAED